MDFFKNWLHFESKREGRFNSDENSFLAHNSIFYPYYKKSIQLAPKEGQSTQWPMFKFAIKYMQTCAFIFKLFVLLCIYLLNTSFCLFVCSFSSHSRIFQSFCCKFWPMIGTKAIEHWGFLACHIYCDTGHPFIMVISDNPWHSHLMPSIWQWSCHYMF